MKSAPAKEAIGAMLDGQIAHMQSENVQEGGGPPRNPKGNGKGGRPKDKTVDPNAEAAKQLQRNIKQFLEVQLMQLVSLEVLKSWSGTCNSFFLWALQMCQTTSIFSAKAARQELESKDAGDGDGRVEGPPSRGWEFEWLVCLVSEWFVCAFYFLLIANCLHEELKKSLRAHHTFFQDLAVKLGALFDFFCELIIQYIYIYLHSFP